MRNNITNAKITFTYNEFIDYVQNTPRTARATKQGHKASEKTKEWGGVESLQEGIDLCRAGWDSGIEQMALEDSFTAQKYIKRVPSMAGGSVNIGRYVSSAPDCMNTFSSNIKYARPRVTIVVPLVYGAFVSEEKAMDYSLDILKLVNSYQTHNDVRLIGVLSSSHDTDVIEGVAEDFIEVVIKDFGERFVLNSVACAFHPCFFRRLYFKYLETTKYVNYGYGSGVKSSRWENFIKAIYKNSGHKVIATQSLNDDRQMGVYKESLNIVIEAPVV